MKMDFASIECAEKIILKTGYLKKLPNKNKFGASFKKWERRWFVFCTVNGSPCLEYYESEDCYLMKEAPVKLIWLATTQYVIQALADEKHENMFNIGMTDRILNLIAPTRGEMESWLKSLETHLARLGIIETAEDRYAPFPGAPAEPAEVENQNGMCRPLARSSTHEHPAEESVEVKKTSVNQPTHVSLPSETVNSGGGASGEVRHEFEDIVEAKLKAKKEFEAVFAQKQALEGGFEDVAEAKAKAKREFEAAEARAASSGIENETAVKVVGEARTLSECSSGSDQVFEDVSAAKKQAQTRMASLGSDLSDSGVNAHDRPLPIPAPRASPRTSPVPPPRTPRKESVDEIDLIKAENKRNEMRQQAQKETPMRDPRSPLPALPPLPPLPTIPDDDDVKKTKSALEPPEKPGAACEKSPRSRRHLEQQLAAGNGRAEENLYEPPRPGGLPPDFPSKPPPPPPTNPGMRRYSGPIIAGPADMYGAVWNENLPPTLPEKKQGPKLPLERQGSRQVRVLSDEEQASFPSGVSSEAPPLPKGRRPSGPPPVRSNSIGAAPIQAAGTFDPDAMRNLMEATSEFNKSLIEHARERQISAAQTLPNSVAQNSMLRQHSVKGIINSPATAVSLKEREVDQLRQEINHPGGVKVQLRKKDCFQTLALVDFLDSVWVAGWNQKASPFLHNAFHIGDRIVSINGQTIIDAQHAQKLISHSSNDVRIDFVVRRTPYASVYAIKRSAEGESLGFKREGGTAEIYQVSSDGLAARHGLPMQACSLDGTSPCRWVLTEVNNRPLNMFFKDKEIEHRLNAVGKDISIMVQPYDFISAIKKLLKKVKGYKDFIVQ